MLVIPFFENTLAPARTTFERAIQKYVRHEWARYQRDADHARAFAARAWVLVIGLARYAFLAAGWALPWLRAALPRRDWRKTVTASQGVALVIAASGVAPLAVSRVLLAVALALLVESFGRDVWWLWRHRQDAPVRRNGNHLRITRFFRQSAK